MAVDKFGNVYTAEVDTGKRIQKFTDLGRIALGRALRGTSCGAPTSCRFGRR
jgi:hypothetical protein